MFPDGRDHQGRAGRLLRGDRAADGAAHERASGDDGALPRRESAPRDSCRRTSSRDSRPGWSASRSPRRTGRCTTRSCPTRGRSSGWPTRTASRRTCGPRGCPTSSSPTSASSISIPPRTSRRTCCARPPWACVTSSRELDLPSWVKTSGSKGFHIVVPLDGKADFGEVGVVRARGGPGPRAARPASPHPGVRQGRPRRAHLRRHRPQRIQRHLRRRLRRPRASWARPCPRPAPGKRSSAAQVGPRTFTLRTMADRVAAVGDLWSDLDRSKRSLKRARARLEGIRIRGMNRAGPGRRFPRVDVVRPRRRSSQHHLHHVGRPRRARDRRLRVARQLRRRTSTGWPARACASTTCSSPTRSARPAAPPSSPASTRISTACPCSTASTARA